MKLNRLLTISGISLLLVLIAGAAAYVWVRPAFLPVYHEGDQRPSASANFSVSTLTLGNQSYESDISEFSLESSGGGDVFHLIGQTDRGNRVYAIPGADPKDYVSVSGFMFPEIIYRSVELPPRNVSDLEVNEIRVLPNDGSGKRPEISVDPAVITEVVEGLAAGADTVPGGSSSGTQQYKLILAPQAISGLDYFAYLFVDSRHQVYLATRLAPEAWIPAGEKLTAWVVGWQQ